MYFSHAFRMTLLGTSPFSPATSGTTAQLTAGQFGLFDQSYTGITYAATASTKPFYLVQGSYYKQTGYSDMIGTHGGYQESVKSKLINPKYISRIFWVSAKAPQQQVVQIPVTCGLSCDTTYRLRVDLKGSPALRFLSHNVYRVLDSYTGCCSTTNPGFTKDPVATIVEWKELINSSAYFNQMVQARAFAYRASITANNTVTYPTLASAVIPTASTTGAGLGQRAIGPNIPANAYVTAITTNTSITITYPTQVANPSIANNVSVALFNDLYGANGGSTTFFNTIVGTALQNTYVGQATYIPGTNTQSNPAGTPTGVNVAAASQVASATGAHVFVPAADAATFSYPTVGGNSTAPFLELTAAYVETKFGAPTFTVTDNYDLEPLKIIASVMDDSGNPCLTTCIGNSVLGDAGIATVVQNYQQASGVGETVLRELILTGRYRQEAFGDGVNIDTFRMREIEANPGVMGMLTLANRNALYNKLCILHNVPRFNNPTSTFDNDQYLIEIAVPQAVGLSSFFANTATAVNGTRLATITNSGSSLLGDYIAAAANTANGVSGATIANASAIVPVEIY